MNEKDYLKAVLEVVQHNGDPVNAIEKLEELGRPEGEVSVNTILVISEIGALEFEREYGALGYIPDDEQGEAFVDAEKSIAEVSLERIKLYISDSQSGNLYSHKFSLSVIYSRFLEDGAYTSSIVFQELQAKSRDGAETELHKLKTEIPKKLPKDERYGIEDIQIRDEVIDKDGKEVNTGSNIIG